MEAFYLYQQQQQQASFFVDPFLHYLPNSPIEIPLLMNNNNNNNHSNNDSSSFTTHYPHSTDAIQEETPTSSELDVVVLLPTMPQPQPPSQSQSSSLEKKRKKSGGSCLTTCQSKGVKGSKSRRKKPNGGLEGEAKEKKSKLADKKSKDTKATIDNEELQPGYIHVRARRGQATDSHSLAERVRRERISERMKKLQGLVPGCDKVIGKALVLDEIINYVQSLQNQVEFLSMKLTSVHPILYGFGVSSEDYMNPVHDQEIGITSHEAMPSAIQNSHTPHTTLEGANNNNNNSLQQILIEPSHPLSFSLHPHGPTSSSSQGSGSFLMEVGDQIRGLILNQAHEINNMGPF